MDNLAGIFVVAMICWMWSLRWKNIKRGHTHGALCSDAYISGGELRYPKTGGAKKGSVHTSSKAVKDTIKEVIFGHLGGKAYLRKIAKKDKALFVSLLARLIPQEIRSELSVHHHTIDLRLAMEAAAKNPALSYSAPASATYTHAPVIDHNPTTVINNGTNNV